MDLCALIGRINIMSTKKIFIYGSCVTRDGVEWWDDYDYELSGYLARQSLISATHPLSTRWFDFSAIRSPFQKRMVRHDVAGTALQEVAQSLENGKYVIWDLCDERRGVIPVDKKGYISPYVLDYGARYKVGRKLHPIRVDSEEFKTLWEQSLDIFMQAISETEQLNHVILNATPWALRDEAGNPLDDYDSICQFNEIQQSMTERIASFGIKAIKPESDVIALSDHKWGKAPFHYVENTYREFLKTLSNYIDTVENK